MQRTAWQRAKTILCRRTTASRRLFLVEVRRLLLTINIGKAVVVVVISQPINQITIKSTNPTANRVFAIYQFLLSWKTHKYYYENRRTPQPKANPTQEKIRLKVAFGTVFPTAKYLFVGWNWFLIGTDYKKPNPTKFSANTLINQPTN